MAKLSIASGPISLNDVRTLFGRTGSISMSEFSSGQPLYADNYNITNLNISNEYSASQGNETWWSVYINQFASGPDGSGTIVTSYSSNVRFRGGPNVDIPTTDGAVEVTSFTPSNSSEADYINYMDDIIGTGKGIPTFWPIMDPECTVSKGNLQTGGTFGPWTNTTNKDNVTTSYRTRFDFHAVNIANSKAASSRTDMNPGLSSGARSFSEMYNLDNGIILDTTFTSSDTDNNGNSTTVKGFLDLGYTNNNGSMANVFTSSRDSRLNGMRVVRCHYIGDFSFLFELQCSTSVSGKRETAKFSKIEVNGFTLYPQDNVTSNAVIGGSFYQYTTNPNFSTVGYQIAWSGGTLPNIPLNSTGNTLKVYA